MQKTATQIHAYAALEQRASLSKFDYEPGVLGSWDIEIAITHCGICHSDLHLVKNDWGFSTYPLVPGHEVVGTIAQRGPEVNQFEDGQRVGVGWQCGSCWSCEYCDRGEEQLCSQNQATCVGRFGGYADRIRLDSRFAFAIPDNLSSEGAAPLLCGGITVFSPLRQYHVTSNMKVGVVGIGGLGHLAVKYARAFGCEVTAFSSSASKEAEVKRLGAHRFILSRDAKQMESAKGSLDFIISTVNVSLDWQSYLDALRPNGSLCIVGVPPEPMSISALPLVLGQKTICGSMIGSRTRIREMLEFSARHSIEAEVEVVALKDVNQAFEKVAQNKARYRIVLKT